MGYLRIKLQRCNKNLENTIYNTICPRRQKNTELPGTQQGLLPAPVLLQSSSFQKPQLIDNLLHDIIHDKHFSERNS